MKLYVTLNNQKVYLNITASTRYELSRKIGYPWFTIQGYRYHVNQVEAESENANTTGGAVVGGLLGLLGGPIGVIAGGVVGGLIGSSNDQNEREKARTFNSSYA